MAFLANIPVLGRLLGVDPDAAAPAVRVAAVPVHAIENDAAKRPRTLKHLLRANHVHHALVGSTADSSDGDGGGDNGAAAGLILSPRHNTLAYALTAAFLLGAGPEHLHALFAALAPGCAPWVAAPAEVTAGDWRAFFGDARYQRGYLDFFEDALAEHTIAAYDWRRVVATYLWEEAAREGYRPPLLLQLLPLPHGHGHGAHGRPLLHLACAFELDSRVLAMEALALAAISCGKRPERGWEGGEEEETKETGTTSASGGGTTPPPPPPLRDLLARVAADPRLDDAAAAAALQASPETLLDDPATESVLLAHWRAWLGGDDDDHEAAAGTDLTPQLRDAQTTAAALLVASATPAADNDAKNHHRYSALLAHALTAAHAVRVLLPHVPRRFHAALLREWWLLALTAYVAAGRPAVAAAAAAVDAGSLEKGQGWAYAATQAMGGRWQTDADYVMVVHALQAAADTWGDADQHYLATAVRFVDDFDGWGA